MKSYTFVRFSGFYISQNHQNYKINTTLSNTWYVAKLVKFHFHDPIEQDLNQIASFHKEY